MSPPFAAPASARRNTSTRLRRGFTAALVLLFAASYASAQKTGGDSLRSLLLPGQQQSTQPKTATPTATPSAQAAQSAAIPLPDVAARSEDLKRMLRNVSNQLPSPDQLAAAKATLDDRDMELNDREKEVDELLADTPGTLELREQENYWRSEQEQTAALRRQLLDWANVAQSALQQLQAQQPSWHATLQQNEGTPGLGPTLDVIRQSIGDLERLTTQAQDQLRTIVNLQVRAASQDQLALDTLDRLSKARESFDRKLFERDSLPLWQLSERRQMGENNEFFLGASQRLLGIRAFAFQAKDALVFLFLLLFASMFGAYRLRLATRHVQPATVRQAQVLRICRHWIALGLLSPLLCAYLLAPLAPLTLIGAVILISFIPILVLLPPLIEPRFRILLYCLAGVYSLSTLISWVGLSPFHKRETEVLVEIVIFALFAYLVRPARVSRAQPGTHRNELRIFGMRLAVAMLGGSVVANVFGYVKLAQFLAVVSLYSTFIAIAMLTGVRVFTLLLLEGVDTAAAQELAVVRCYGEAITRWVPRVLQWSGALVWFTVTVNLLGLSAWLDDALAKTFGFHIAGSSANITLGGVLGFFLILLVGYAISSAIRFLLREELLSRFHFARGVPELISSTFHYLLLLLVFFFAINAGGVELNKFTVLTGALGVGVGFGLQNIVNNFISGLILQFERPIHIGDVLDIDGATGRVTRIGIRSSTIKTYQGAELIIPNGNFISGKVINWTLSNAQRRLELPVGVAYGSDVKLVARLLEQAATTHESVLTLPAPAAYFKEFGDSSLNFELQFWVMQESGATVKVKSEVALAVMELLDKEGIEIPFPQRDLRLRAVNPDAAAALLSPDGSQNDCAANDSQHPEPNLLFGQVKGRRAGE